ncbi:YMGG-like glycine zipper-containing protein [Bdellovibrionota bacterium FG-1]
MIRISCSRAIALVLLTSSCATAPQSILLGASSGAVVGGAAGLAIRHNATGTAIGAATGALAGGLIGWLLHHDKPSGQSSNPQDAEKYPFLTRPEVRTLWVPDSVEGNRYIERHRVFIIDKNSSWSKDND